MKCKQCNAEIQKGKLYCSECGCPIQIVPDYNEFEEDFVPGLLEDKEPEKKEEEVPVSADPEFEEEEDEEEEPQKNHRPIRHRRRRYIFAAAGALILVLLVLIGAVYYRNYRKQEHSFAYQYAQGLKAQEAGEYDSAVSYFNKAISLDDQNKDVRYSLAELYIAMGDRNSAKAVYEDVIVLDETCKESYARLLAFYEEDNDTDSILALMENITDPDILSLFLDYEVEEPEFLTEDGTFQDEVDVEISGASDCNVFYTLDGSDPSKDGDLYTEPIKLSEEGIYNIFAVCCNEKGIYSKVVSHSYTIEVPSPEIPVVNPDGGDFVYQTALYISVPENCEAYYEWGEDTPDQNSHLYEDPIYIPEGNHVLSVIYYNTVTEKWGPVYRGRYTYYPDVSGSVSTAETAQEEQTDSESSSSEEEEQTDASAEVQQ